MARTELLEAAICDEESDNPRLRKPFKHHFRDGLPPVIVDANPFLPEAGWQRKERHAIAHGESFRGYHFSKSAVGRVVDAREGSPLGVEGKMMGVEGKTML